MQLTLRANCRKQPQLEGSDLPSITTFDRAVLALGEEADRVHLQIGFVNEALN